jgi:hypothetical protein
MHETEPYAHIALYTYIVSVNNETETQDPSFRLAFLNLFTLEEPLK